MSTNRILEVTFGRHIKYIEGIKEGLGYLRHFQQHRSYRNKIETHNLEDIPFSLGIVKVGLLVAEGP